MTQWFHSPWNKDFIIDLQFEQAAVLGFPDTIAVTAQHCREVVDEVWSLLICTVLEAHEGQQRAYIAEVECIDDTVGMVGHR